MWADLFTYIKLFIGITVSLAGLVSFFYGVWSLFVPKFDRTMMLVALIFGVLLILVGVLLLFLGVLSDFQVMT